MTPLLLAAALAAGPGCPTALSRAAALSDGELATEAPRLVRTLGSQGAGGPTQALDDEALRSGSAGDAARGAAGARFRAALAHHCALASQAALPAPTPADRARAAEILDRAEFRRASADPDALRRRLLELVDRLLALLETPAVQGYAAFSRLVFLAAVAVAALLGLAALRRRRVPRTTPGRDPEPARSAPGARLDRAEEAAARGQAGPAIRLALRAALAALERRGAVPGGGSLTNQELIDQLDAAEPARGGALRALARLFDRTVYGGVPATEADAAAALAAARALVAEESP